MEAQTDRRSEDIRIAFVLRQWVFDARSCFESSLVFAEANAPKLAREFIDRGIHTLRLACELARVTSTWGVAPLELHLAAAWLREMEASR